MEKASSMYTAIQGLDFVHIQYGTAQTTRSSRQISLSLIYQMGRQAEQIQKYRSSL